MDVEWVKQTMIVCNLFFRLNYGDSQHSTLREDLTTNTTKRVKNKGLSKGIAKSDPVYCIADVLPTVDEVGRC
jgi:hypothetical protein